MTEPSSETATHRRAQSSFFAATLLSTFELLALSLWIGGIAIVGAIVAPVAFNAILASPLVNGDIAAHKALAGSIIGGSLRVFNVISYVCGVILIAGTLARRGAPAFAARLSLVILCVVISLTLGFAYFPAMDAAQTIRNLSRFDNLHHEYELLAQAQLFLLIAFVVAYARSLQSFSRSRK